jgi:hypothetical protein
MNVVYFCACHLGWQSTFLKQKEKIMSNFTDYAERASERYNVLSRIGQPDTNLAQGYVPLKVQRGPAYVESEWPRVQQALKSARNRAHEAQIKERLESLPQMDLLRKTPFGPAMSLQDVVGPESRLALLGQPGAGKTTALRYLAAQLAPAGEEAGLLTFLVDLPDLAASECPLTEYLSQDAAQHMDLSLSPDFFQKALKNGQALLCLDDLDGIAGQAERAVAVGQIEAWAEQYPRCPIVVTARSDVYEPSLDGDVFARYVLSPWSDTVVADLEGTWSEKEVEAQSDSAPRLAQDILAARSLVAMYDGDDVNPLWQEMRAHLWEFDWRQRLALTWRFLAQDHPEVWGRLLHRVLDMGLNDPLKLALHRHVLVAAAALAATDVSDELEFSPRRRTVDALVEWMADPDAAGRQDAVDALFRLGHEPYAFEAVSKALGDESADEWAREAAFLLLGELGEANGGEAVDTLQAGVDNEEESELLRQVASTSLGRLVSSGALDEASSATVTDGLLARLRNPALSIGLRVALGEALGPITAKTQSAESIAALTALARAENEGEDKVPFSVQTAAAGGLCTVLSTSDDAQFVETMWALARDETVDDGVRSMLTEALGKLGNAEDAAQVLLALARSDKIYPPGRRGAMEALGRIGYADQTVVDGLVTISQTKDRKTKDFERFAAACALCEVGHLDVGLQHLLMLVADKSIYRSTRNDALAYMGKLGFTGDEALDEAMVAVLRVWATEENTTEDVRECAVDALRTLGAGSDELVRDLIGVIQDKKDYPRVRRVTAEMLGGFPIEGSELLEEGLGAVLYDPEEKSDLLRVPIARLLVRWAQDESALTYLKAAAEQSYMALVRYKAAMFLQELDELDAATETLLKLATNSDIADPIRCDALRAIGLWKVGDEDLVNELKPILQEADILPNVREAVYGCLCSGAQRTLCPYFFGGGEFALLPLSSYNVISDKDTFLHSRS